jgi:hypothetical protein
MSWDVRGGGRAYYYEAVRVSGQPRRQYVGRGAVGLQAAGAVLLRRRRRAELAQRKQQDRDRDDLAQAVCRWAELLLEAVLLAAGFRRQRRGPWRLRRGVPAPTSAILFEAAAGPALRLLCDEDEGSMSTTTDETRPLPVLQEELALVVQRAQKGDMGTLPTLRAFLDAHPEVWREVGDLARHAALCAVPPSSARDLLLRESVARKLEEHRAELEGDQPTKVERLLVERILLDWVQVHYADVAAAEARDKDGGGSPLSVYAQRRLDSAHKRYLRGLRQLAAVQRLLGRMAKPKAAPRSEDADPPLPGDAANRLGMPEAARVRA